MPDTTSLIVLFMDVMVALFAFFGVAPVILNAVSLFGVQKRFAQMMIREGIVTEESVKMIHPKKQIAGVVISCVVLAALATAAWRNAPFGYLCAGIPLLAGFLKYRKIVQYNSLTVQRFKNTYKDAYDIEKLNKFIKDNF